MNEIVSLPPVTDDEFLARFVLFRGWIRSGDSTVRPDAFIPYPYPDLSVTRHIGLSVEEVWQIGQAVADRRPATLYGRADIRRYMSGGKPFESFPLPSRKTMPIFRVGPRTSPRRKLLPRNLLRLRVMCPIHINSQGRGQLR